MMIYSFIVLAGTELIDDSRGHLNGILWTIFVNKKLSRCVIIGESAFTYKQTEIKVQDKTK